MGDREVEDILNRLESSVTEEDRRSSEVKMVAIFAAIGLLIMTGVAVSMSMGWVSFSMDDKVVMGVVCAIILFDTVFLFYVAWKFKKIVLRR